MVVRKFFAPGTREALKLVRDALGEQAMILSNRPVPGGVEITAVSEHEVTVVRDTVAPATTRAKPPTPLSSAALAVDSNARARAIERAAHRVAAAYGDAADPDDDTEPTLATPARGARAEPARAIEPAAPAITTEALATEVRALRALVEGQLASLAWRDVAARSPAQAELTRELVSRGFSGGFARAFATQWHGDGDTRQALRWAKQVLMSTLRCVPAGDDLVTRGGIYALVGPTGVGKTTTVAKLAASSTLRHGAAQVALITTDTYRIGAVDQLRIYGRILGIPVFAVKEGDDLAGILDEVRGRRVVLIDTVGMSQRDQRVAAQLELLGSQSQPVQRLLLMSAVAQGDALEDIVKRYSTQGLAGCILTKVDEAVTFGAAIDVMVRAKLPLHYVTNGQRVPEDLHLASALYLVERAFRGDPQPSAFRALPADMPFALAAQATRPAAVAPLAGP
jgi:flagellar biosynthesis protein FlhF